MAKFKIKATLTSVQTFDETEIEADIQEEAEGMVREMIEEGQIAPDSDDATYGFETSLSA